MEAQALLNLLSDTTELQKADMGKLDDWLARYPYAANLYVTKALALHEQQHTDFEPALQQAAARTISRRRLHLLIEGYPRLEVEWLPAQPLAEPEPENLQSPDATDAPHEPEENLTEAKQAAEEEQLSAREQAPAGEKAIRKNSFAFSFVKVSKSRMNEKPAQAPHSPYDISQAKPEKAKKKPAQKQDAIIDRFLETNPSLSPPTLDFGQPKQIADLSEASIRLQEEITTENMAIIYLKQKNYEKALTIYQKLLLKYPEKGDYFAALIKNLENKLPKS